MFTFSMVLTLKLKRYHSLCPQLFLMHQVNYTLTVMFLLEFLDFIIYTVSGPRITFILSGNSQKEVKIQESTSLLKAANSYSEWKVKMKMKTRLPVWFFMFAVLVLKGCTQVLLQNKCVRHAVAALKTPLCLLIAQFFGTIYNRLIPAGCNWCASFNSPHLMLPRFIACIRWEQCKMSMGLASALNHHSERSYHI